MSYGQCSQHVSIITSGCLESLDLYGCFRWYMSTKTHMGNTDLSVTRHLALAKSNDFKFVVSVWVTLTEETHKGIVVQVSYYSIA